MACGKVAGHRCRHIARFHSRTGRLDTDWGNIKVAKGVDPNRQGFKTTVVLIRAGVVAEKRVRKNEGGSLITDESEVN